MDTHRHPLIILVFLVSLHFYSSTSYAVPPDIIGRDKGWVLSPFGGNIHWDEHFKFHVILLKSDEKGSNLVLEVSKEDYENCNTKNPIKKMDDGNSMFQFGRSGTVYIISGNQESCEKGKKFIIVVPPMRNNPPDHPPTATLVQPAETPAPSVGTPGTTPSSKGSLATALSSQSSPPSLPLGRVSEVASTKGSSTITPSRHAPKVVSPKGFVGSSPISYSPSRVPPKRFTPTSPEVIPPKRSISSSANALSSLHAPVKAPTSVAHLQPPSHTARTSILPSIASKIPSSLSPTTPHAPSSNISPVMSPQGSRNIPSSSSSSPTPLPAPSSNQSPVTSPQGPSNIAPIPSGSPPKSNSAIAMAITPTLILASVLSLSISVALQELFTIYH